VPGDEQQTFETEFLVLEIFLKTVPSIVFLFASYVRFQSIRSYGFARTVVYSQMLKWKIFLSATMCATWLILIILVFVKPSSIVDENWFSVHGKEYWCLVYIFNVVAWAVCPFLLTYEYRKRLPEAWYTHKFFWLVNLVVNFIIIILLFQVYVSILFRYNLLLGLGQ
jgi:hypothetical protein